MTPLHYYLITCGMGLAVLFLWQIKRLLKVLLSDGRALGHVVGHEKQQFNDSTYLYPVIAFVDHNGIQRHVTQSAEWSTTPLGTEVHVRYLRQNPELAYIDSFFHLWLEPLVVVGFAALIFFFVWYPNSCLNHHDHDTCRWSSIPEL